MQTMSSTFIATQSWPTVSCLSSAKAILSLVPTPSAPETSTGRLCRLPGRCRRSRPVGDTASVWVAVMADLTRASRLRRRCPHPHPHRWSSSHTPPPGGYSAVACRLGVAFLTAVAYSASARRGWIGYWASKQAVQKLFFGSPTAAMRFFMSILGLSAPGGRGSGRHPRARRSTVGV